MAKSITASQAELLASGFLDTTGSSKDELVPKSSLTTLFKLSGFLVEEAQKNLARSDRVASGALSESIKILDPYKKGKTIHIDVEALFYYLFIDGGVKGTKGGTGLYQFKNDKPSKKMVAALRKWLQKEGIKGSVDKKYRGISKRDDFRKSITDTGEGIAYAISRSIKQKGLKRTNFMAKAIAKTENKAEKEFGAAFKIDVINSLPATI
jgi:hypothetical protein